MANPPGRGRLSHGRYYGAGNPTLGTGQEYPFRVTAAGELIVSVGGGGGGAVTVQGEYLVTPPVLSDTDLEDLQLDVNGNLKVVEQYAPQAEDNVNDVIAIIEKPLVGATYAPTIYSFLPAASGTTGIVIKASAANLFALRCVLDSLATPCYLQLFNRTTVPPGGTVPQLSFALLPSVSGAGGLWAPVLIDHSIFTQAGMAFTSGLVWGTSSTAATFTGTSQTLELLATYL